MAWSPINRTPQKWLRANTRMLKALWLIFSEKVTTIIILRGIDILLPPSHFVTLEGAFLYGVSDCSGVRLLLLTALIYRLLHRLKQHVLPPKYDARRWYQRDLWNRTSYTRTRIMTGDYPVIHNHSMNISDCYQPDDYQYLPSALCLFVLKLTTQFIPAQIQYWPT